MLGNDLVDLQDAETLAGAQHPRFDARVFRSAERAAIDAAPCPESARRARWAIFAAKEACYKLVRRLDPSTPFVPARFGVTLEGPSRGRVVHAGRSLDVVFEERAGGLHAVAVLAGAPAAGRLAAFGVTAAGEDESAAARALARRRIAKALGVDVARLAVLREERLPALLLDGAPLEATLSLAHHGRFVGFACQLASTADGRHRLPAPTGGAR